MKAQEHIDINEEIHALTNPPRFSVLILSHNKWPMVCQAINSVIAQTWKHWDMMIVDSGKLADQLANEYLDYTYEAWSIRLEESNEPADLRQHGINPAAWVLNRFLPTMRRDWSFYLCDDDYLLPTYMEAMAEAIMAYPSRHAFWTGEVRAVADERGSIRRINGAYYAEQMLGPGFADRQVDYLQFMHDRWLWEEVRKKFGSAYPEELSVANHGDGIFMERAVSICPALPVPGIHCVNRRTPFSQFCGNGQ